VPASGPACAIGKRVTDGRSDRAEEEAMTDRYDDAPTPDELEQQVAADPDLDELEETDPAPAAPLEDQAARAAEGDLLEQRQVAPHEDDEGARG
jgi:hypothetical protein